MQQSWTLDDIDWPRYDAAKVSPDVLKVIKAAAMVERNGADYGRYLSNVFRDDPAFCAVADAWAAEEEQHGAALGRWAGLADPAFHFDKCFSQFTEMYRIPVDATASVRGSRTAELCARCVVETGTSSFYSAIRDAVDEPVLKQICANIAADEFRHFKLFFTHMERYAAQETAARTFPKWDRLRVAFTRFREVDDDEIASAYHAGNAVAGPYDRSRASADYGQRAFGFYQKRHVRRAGYMFAQAAGLAPDGWAAKLLVRVLWMVVGFRGRKFRPKLVAA
ncbi:MAG: ferritin-like domain-containing protein [Rhodospirillaceae bacterium]|nr:ferritin-like domain-containing protein [Rhodospirillaceae bacterium]